MLYLKQRLSLSKRIGAHLHLKTVGPFFKAEFGNCERSEKINIFYAEIMHCNEVLITMLARQNLRAQLDHNVVEIVRISSWVHLEIQKAIVYRIRKRNL